MVLYALGHNYWWSSLRRSIYNVTAVYIFSNNQVDLVADDYYKKSIAINIHKGNLKLFA
ncbi:FixH family protein [Photobacterium angustum]|uniref:FixH family protein n=1 Tax=Photobacterium angustum TaxID=661 RepID=UPI0009E21CFD